MVDGIAPGHPATALSHSMACGAASSSQRETFQQLQHMSTSVADPPVSSALAASAATAPPRRHHSQAAHGASPAPDAATAAATAAAAAVGLSTTNAAMIVQGEETAPQGFDVGVGGAETGGGSTSPPFPTSQLPKGQPPSSGRAKNRIASALAAISVLNERVASVNEGGVSVGGGGPVAAVSTTTAAAAAADSGWRLRSQLMSMYSQV